MKIILSRKAFDSGAGKVANPILDDGSMIPMPIPDMSSRIRYQDITVAGHNLGTVAAELTGGRSRADHFGHLDPDLSAGALPREPGWKPLFGQQSAAQTVLSGAGVGPGDLFLFFGWFRRATRASGQFRYIAGAPHLHVLWGWLQVGDVVPVGEGPHPAWMTYHPHLVPESRGPNNTLYVASDHLQLPGLSHDLPGAGTFGTYDERLRLTKPGASRSTWLLPSWFTPGPGRPALGYHSKPTRWTPTDDGVQLDCVGRGQEFVLDADYYPEAPTWAADLIGATAATQ